MVTINLSKSSSNYVSAYDQTFPNDTAMFNSFGVQSQVHHALPKNVLNQFAGVMTDAFTQAGRDLDINNPVVMTRLPTTVAGQNAKSKHTLEEIFEITLAFLANPWNIWKTAISLSRNSAENRV
ncbi:hypothetical protein [Algicella marina]|uniref:Uncharacterized protein n=1 Tax=Algicella marina TaxID=2683284 RepID=A0A6P1T490_9RHOB|nr:hypothetical protein [Algicella marina]QHQ35352.1 hypothetical protein GO499_09165 [Algicella marina]